MDKRLWWAATALLIACDGEIEEELVEGTAEQRGFVLTPDDPERSFDIRVCAGWPEDTADRELHLRIRGEADHTGSAGVDVTAARTDGSETEHFAVDGPTALATPLIARWRDIEDPCRDGVIVTFAAADLSGPMEVSWQTGHFVSGAGDWGGQVVVKAYELD